MTDRAAAAPARSTRDQILDVAERAFAERGFDGVSVREIVAEVGLKNQASLYHHFRDKHALYEAALERGVDALIAAVAEGLQAATPLPTPGGTMVDVGLDRLLDYLAEHPHLPRLIQRAGLDDNPDVAAIATRLLRPLYEQGIALLGGRTATWSASELPHVGAGLYHLIFGYFASAPLLEAVIGTDPRTPAAVARQRRFVKDALARLLAPPRAGRAARGGRRP